MHLSTLLRSCLLVSELVCQWNVRETQSQLIHWVISPTCSSTLIWGILWLFNGFVLLTGFSVQFLLLQHFYVDAVSNKKLIRRWDSEREVPYGRHRTRTAKYNRLVYINSAIAIFSYTPLMFNWRRGSPGTISVKFYLDVNGWPR